MNAGDWISLAAVVVAIGALVVSLTERRQRRESDRKQVALAERLAAIEVDRHRAERQPAIVARYRHYAGQPAVEFVNEGPIDLEEVGWSLVETDDSPLIVGLGVPGSDEVGRSGSLGRMTLGHAELRFIRPQGQHPSGTLQFRITARLADDEWVSLTKCEIPPQPFVSML